MGQSRKQFSGNRHRFAQKRERIVTALTPFFGFCSAPSRPRDSPGHQTAQREHPYCCSFAVRVTSKPIDTFTTMTLP